MKQEEVKDLPVFGQESLEQLVQEILAPLYQGKRHQALLGAQGALSVPFVKDILADLELLYHAETAKKVTVPDFQASGDVDRTITCSHKTNMKRSFWRKSGQTLSASSMKRLPNK